MKEMKYQQVGDYKFPVLKQEESLPNLTRFGQMYLKHLKENYKSHYLALLAENKLNDELLSIDQQMNDRYDLLVKQLVEERNINEELKNILEWIICIIIAVILGLWIRYYIMTPTQVRSVSMKPTLIEGQRLILNRTIRLSNKLPERGDIITFEAPTEDYLTEAEFKESPIARYNEPEGGFNKFVHNVLEIGKTSYIKRVIGLPGDYVEIKDGAVYINGEKLQEDYLQSGVVTDMHQDATHEGNFTGFTVPENCVFCLGDNRTGSRDCRSFGCIPLEKIEGKVLFRFWPLNKFGKV